VDARPLVTAQLIGSLHAGGAEHLAVQIANACAAAGNRSHIYVLDGPGPLSSKISPDVTVRYFDHRIVSPSRPWRCLISVRDGYRQLAANLAADGVDVLQSHLPGANFWGLLLSVRGHCAVIPTVHSNREFDYGDTANSLRAWGRRWAYKRMLNRCDAVVAVSDKVRDSLLAELGLKRHHCPRLVVVPNGVTIPEPLSAEDRVRIRERYDLEPGVFFALAAGRHCELKHYELLIDVIGILRDRGLDVHLVLAGDGPLSARYRERVSARGLAERVHIPGHLDDLPQVMQSADCFVISSLWEGLSLVMLEAMACGLPVVGTRISGVEDVIEDGVNGVLAVPGDAEELAHAVSRLVSDATLRESCRIAGQELVERDFSITRVARDLEVLYRRAVARKEAS